MKPKITIDKYAIRFEDDSGQTNHFFLNLFIGKDNWQAEVLMAIQKAYEICIKEDIKAELSEEDLSGECLCEENS
jgi:hypothetical protein